MARLSTVEERFETRVLRHEDGCWEWVGALLPTGYGQFWPYGRAGGKQFAHRVAYELYVGPIPEGLVLDHLCHTTEPNCPGGLRCPHRRCVNPAHLEPVTAEVNQRRAAGWTVQDGRWLCSEGHPIDEDHFAEVGRCVHCFNVYKREWRAIRGNRQRENVAAQDARIDHLLLQHPALASEVEAIGLLKCRVRLRSGWTYDAEGWISARQGRVPFAK